jgi:hypothetical protein
MAKPFVSFTGYKQAVVGNGPELPRYRLVLDAFKVASVEESSRIGCVIHMDNGDSYHVSDNMTAAIIEIERARHD